MLKVDINEAKKFSQVWTHNGIVVPLLDPHLQFAADFATVTLNSFIQQAQAQAAAAAKQKAQAEAAKVTLT